MMDEVITVVTKCITQLDRLVYDLADASSRKAATTIIATMGKCFSDHAYLFTRQQTCSRRIWELICPTFASEGTSGTPASPTSGILSLFQRLTDAIAISTRAPEAEILKHVTRLLGDAVKPPLVHGASLYQVRRLFEASMRLSQTLRSLSKYPDLQAECLHLLFALVQMTVLASSHGVIVASENDVVQLVMLCTDVCAAKHEAALRPQRAAMQLLGCLCEKSEYASAFSGELVKKTLSCFLDVAKKLTQRNKVNQTLGEGLLRGLTGFLGSFPLCREEDAPVLTLFNNIVLSALSLGDTSNNYTFCLSALFLLRCRAHDTLAPFTRMCAAQYSTVLKALWMHRNKDIRRESRSASVAFWSTLSSQLLLRQPSTVEEASTVAKSDASHTLDVVLGSLLVSLDSTTGREAAYALEALYHLLPAITALDGLHTLHNISERLEKRVEVLLATTSAAQTEALFRQLPYLLVGFGQLLALLPSASQRQQAMVRELLRWVLLFYPHSGFYDREKMVPSIVTVITALMHHPRTPDHTLPLLLSMHTLELVGAAPGSAMMMLANERITIEERLSSMAALWTRLLTPCETPSRDATMETQQRLSSAFFQNCKDFCDQAQLQVVTLGSRCEVTPENVVVWGGDDCEPRIPTQYGAFLSFVDFFVRLNEKLRRLDRVFHPPAREMTAWLDTLVRGVRVAPHVSGFYTLIHRTVLGEGVFPHPCRQEQPYRGASPEMRSPSVTSQDADDHRCTSPNLLLFLDAECLRGIHVYSGEILYQCAMCVVAGVALVGMGKEDEMRENGARGDNDRRLDAYVRAFKVVLEATPIARDGGDANSATKTAQWCFGSSLAVLEGNRQCALRVLEKKVSRSPRWASAVLPALTSALRHSSIGAAMLTSVHMLAAQYGVQIAAELQRKNNTTTLARLCKGDGGSSGLGNSMPRWMATMQPITVPLCVLDSALRIGYLIPLVSTLSLHSNEPAVRAAAAEVLHWCIIWRIAKRFSCWDSVIFPPLLSLASLSRTSTADGGDNDGGAAHHKLYKVLLQVARWFGRPAGALEEAELFMRVLFRSLGEQDLAQRHVAMECLLAYAIPPADEPQAVTPHFGAVIRQLVMMQCGVSEWLRLGASQCVRVMMRHLKNTRAPGQVSTVHAVVRGAMGCLGCSTEIPQWGPVETVTCTQVQEALRCVAVYCHNLLELEDEEEAREGVHDVVDLIHAASALLPDLAQRHSGCAITLLQALQALIHASADVQQTRSLSKYLIREQELRLSSATARADTSVIGACAVLVQLLRSGCCTQNNPSVLTNALPPGCSARRDECSVAPELLHLLKTLLQAIVDEAHVAAHANGCMSPHLLKWLLELVDVVPEQTHATHFVQLLTPTFISQAVRLMVARATASVTDEEEQDNRDTSGVALQRNCHLSFRLPRTVWLCLELIQLIMCIVGEGNRRAQVVEEVLSALRDTNVFHLFTEASPFSNFVNTLRLGPWLPVVGAVTLAAALTQVDAPCPFSPRTMWALIADSMGVSPKTVLGMLRALLQNFAALNATDSEDVCVGLLILFINEADPVSLGEDLRELSSSDAVPHNCSLSSISLSALNKNNGAEAASSSAISGLAVPNSTFDGVMTRCLQKASAVLSTDRLIYVLPAWKTVVMPEALRRDPGEALLPLRFVENLLAELQERSLTSEHDKVLCRLCSEIVALEQETREVTQTEMRDDGSGAARRSVLLRLVNILGPSICNNQTLSRALRDLCLSLSKPPNVYGLLSSTVATDRVVWGFDLLAAMITPRPVSRSLDVPPVDPKTVQAASELLDEVLNNALPLRWEELKAPLEKTNAAKGVLSGTALFAAVLPHNVQVLETMVTVLAKESMPQRDMIALRVREALQKLCCCDTCVQLDALRCILRLLRDARTHTDIYDALTNDLLLPLLDASAKGVRLQVFEEEIGHWITEAGMAPVPGRFCVQTAAFASLALMHHLCPLVDLRGSINEAFMRRDPKATGREVTQEVLRACRAAWLPRNTVGPNADGEVNDSLGSCAPADELCRYRQAAFHCLVATLSQTHQAESIFCQCFFQPRTIPGWNALFIAKNRYVAVTGLQNPGGKAAPVENDSVDQQWMPLWRSMDSCRIPELFAHLIHQFPASPAAPSEPPDWVLRFVTLAQHGQLCLCVKLVFYKIVRIHERFFGTFARRIFDGVADSVAAVPPSEPTGRTIWGLLSVLAKWRRENESAAFAVGSTVSLKAVARYAVLHYTWEHSFTIHEEDSQETDATSQRILTELLEQVSRAQGATPATLSSSSPLLTSEVKMLLSDAACELRVCLKVIYLVARACGGLGCTEDSDEVVEVYKLLSNVLDASASPQLYLNAARLLGLEHRLLSEAERQHGPSTVRGFLRNSIESVISAVLSRYESEKKYLDVITEMQKHGSEDLVNQLLSRTDLLHRYSTQKDSEKIVALRLLAHATTYVADNYDRIHVCLTTHLRGANIDFLLNIYKVARNALPHLTAKSVHSVLRDVCLPDALHSLRSAEQARIVFYEMCLVALKRWAALKEDENMRGADDSVSTYVKTLVVHGGLRDRSPAVQSLVLDYLDTDAAHVPEALWERLTCLFTTDNLVKENRDEGGKGWVRYVAILLLSLAKRSHNYDNPTYFFSEPLHLAGKSPKVMTKAAVAVEGSVARPQSRNEPLFSQAILYGGKSCTATVKTVCPDTAAFCPIHRTPPVLPHPPPSHRQTLSGAGRPRVGGAWGLDTTLRRDAGITSTSTASHHRGQVENEYLEQNIASASAWAEASKGTDEMTRLCAPNRAVPGDLQSRVSASSSTPLLVDRTNGRFPEVRLTLKSLMAPLHVLCLHDDEVAARLLFDLVSNASDSTSDTCSSSCKTALTKTLTFVLHSIAPGVGGRKYQHANRPFDLFFTLEFLLHVSATYRSVFDTLDHTTLVRLTSAAQACGSGTTAASVPLMDGIAHATEMLLSSLPTPPVTRDASTQLPTPYATQVWHAYHVAQRLRRHDDMACQAALRLFRATRGHAAQVTEIQGALDSMEVGGASYSARAIAQLLENEKNIKSSVLGTAPSLVDECGEVVIFFSAREEVLRHYQSRAARILMDWGGAASALQSATLLGIGDSEEVNTERMRLHLRSQLRLMCDSATPAATTRDAEASQPCGVYEWGAHLLAHGRWLDCQHYVETSVDHLLGSGTSQARWYLAANSLWQLANAAQVLRTVSTSDQSKARVALLTYLSTMPAYAPIDDTHGPLFVDDVLLTRKLVINHHGESMGVLATSLRLTEDERHDLVAQTHELLGAWTVQRCVEMLPLLANTSAIATMAANASCDLLSETTRFSIELLEMRSNLFLITVMPVEGHSVSREETFFAFQEMTRKVVQRRAAAGRLPHTAVQQWAADVARCGLELLTSFNSSASVSVESTAEARERFVAALNDNLQNTMESHMTFLNVLGKLLPPVSHDAQASSLTAEARSHWQLYVNTFLWCAQVADSSSVETSEGGHLSVAARVPRLISLFQLPAVTEVSARAQWNDTLKSVALLPAYVWLPWATLVVKALLQTRHAVVAQILLRLCREHEQVLFYPVNRAWSRLDNLGRCGDAEDAIDEELECELVELRKWYRNSRLALVAEFSTVLDELVEPPHRLAARLGEVERLIQQYEKRVCDSNVDGGHVAQGEYSLQALKLFECYKDELMNPSRWKKAQVYHRHAAQVLQRLDRRRMFSMEVFRSSKMFHSAKSDALIEVTRALEALPAMNASRGITGSQDLRLYSERLPRVLGSSALASTAAAQLGYTQDAAEPIHQPLQPTQLLHSPQDIAHQSCRLVGVGERVLVLDSKRLPKKVNFHTTADICTYLVKGGKDLRVAQRIQEVFTFANLCLLVSPRTRSSALIIRTYAVIPVSPFVGLVSWVPRAVPLVELMKEATPEAARNAVSHFCRSRDEPQNVHLFYAGPPMTRLPEEEYQALLLRLRQSALTESLESIAPDHCSWFRLRDAFFDTNAAASTLSFVLGIGNRHARSLMIDLANSELVAIDVGMSFGDAARTLAIPELMPFRHTPQLQHVQGVLGNDIMRCRMRRVLHVLRREKHVLEELVAELLLPDLDTIREGASLIAAHQLDVVRRKLNLESPAHIILRDVALNPHVTQHKNLWWGVKACLSEEGDKEDSDLAEAAPSTLHREDVFIRRLLRIASDPRVLGRANARLQTYL